MKIIIDDAEYNVPENVVKDIMFNIYKDMGIVKYYDYDILLSGTSIQHILSGTGTNSMSFQRYFKEWLKQEEIKQKIDKLLTDV